MKKHRLALLALLLLLIAIIAWAYGRLMPLNEAVRSFIDANLWKPFYPAALFLHFFFETALGTLQTLAWGAVLLFLYKSRGSAALLVLTLLAQSNAVSLIKALTGIPRPPQEYFGVFYHNFSYPSGHTATAVTFAIMLAYLLVFRLKRREGRPIAAAYGAVAVLTAYSRMYLDVHWLMDIVGGMLTAGFISLLFITVDQRLGVPGRRNRGIN